MRLVYRYNEQSGKPLKHFLKEQGISKKLLAKTKFTDGKICVNNKEENVRYLLQINDIVTVDMPSEPSQNNIIPVDIPIDILYEDEYLVAVNKPSGVASIPSYLHPKFSMANRVKGYFVRQNYQNQVIHIVTRLDRDTSGVMLFAKHQLVHSFLDKQLRNKMIDKSYIAIAGKSEQLQKHGLIEAKIGRSPHSIMIREVNDLGKESLTEYWELKQYHDANLYRIKLHTGRTHQIRVHFTYCGAPLLGDELYGGNMDSSLTRQALHCERLVFDHPFKNEKVSIEASLPDDIKSWLMEQGE